MTLTDPITARKGTFIRSFDNRDFDTMIEFGKLMEKTAERMRCRRTFTYTQICRTYNHHRIGTWQIFLMPEGWNAG